VSSLGLASRWLAYIAGFGGGKERGITMIETALESGEAWIEGGAALLLIYTREGRHEDAYRLALRLAEHYPDNRIVRLEAGAAAVRAGLGAEAERVLSAGLTALDNETRPLIPGERAIWLYKRGMARLVAGQPDRARADLDAALESGPHGWMRGRVLVGIGKVHDLAGRRVAATAAYAEARDVCEKLDDVIGRDEARALLRRPFSTGGRLE